MKQTGDLNLVKKINKSIVLHHIRTDSPISRARIAEITGLTKATVSSLVNELIESSLVDEIGAGESSGGRKPMMLLFNGTAGYAIGVDLGVHDILAVLTDLTGKVISEKRVQHDNASVESVIQLLKLTIRNLIDSAPASTYGIIGIGIGVPGICDDDGNLLFAPNLSWENVPLQKDIEEAFGIPVVIDNEANAGAVGEKQFGTGKDTANLVYISIGIGIGAGIIIKGELYRGATGFSGEIGHISIQHDGPKCRCGSLGCWELYASEHALLEQARLELGEPAQLDMLLSKAEAGDQKVIALFERLGYYLGVGVVNIINGYNPEFIILGGRLAGAEKWLMKPLLQLLEKRSLPLPRKLLNVEFSQLSDRSTVLGAASFAVSKFFASTTVSIDGN
ncbi:ROK family transcriptional regulator [Paenibacillus sp. CGMCC 1.16610]|uniref:ROK family protein n=1 Tax=Paenibacillus anseongense TaxID=2682845 RepID=A0ABW9UDR7_9BACL|nr:MULTISPECIES: ROK family transcriptional regulator [Paenibacillus]MBA2942827.1 ROK family transcriptional regulator [Paenibacillus sp. CGMCC 1.16610]MVQ38312.1 ROK family protein [Paenibacillus anseongense]